MIPLRHTDAKFAADLSDLPAACKAEVQPMKTLDEVEDRIAAIPTRLGLNSECDRQLIYAAAAKAERDEPDLTWVSAAAKCFASDTAMSVTTDAVQLFGGYGYCRDYPVEKFMRDAKITQIYEGTNQIQRMVIGRALIKEGASA